MLQTAYEAFAAGGSAGCTLNAADEIAVEAFLQGRLSLGGMSRLVRETLQRVPVRTLTGSDDLLAVDQQSRQIARQYLAQGLGYVFSNIPRGGKRMNTIQDILAFLVLIGVMILIHELGHYLAAVYFDVHVETFSIGFGKRLFGFQRGETEFKVCVIPYGGYVKMAGEQPGEEAAAAEDPRSFLNKPRWQRLIVAGAGPFMNVMLSIVLLTGVYMVQFPKRIDAGAPARLGFIAEGSPAAIAGSMRATAWSRSTTK